MAKATIELDWQVIREAIDAEVAPAVRRVLAEHYDIPAMIARELVRRPEETKVTLDIFRAPIFTIGAELKAGPLLLDRMVSEAVRAAAQRYIEETIEDRREALRATFRRMMRDSPDRLANAFVGMMEGAALSLEIDETIRLAGADDDG